MCSNISAQGYAPYRGRLLALARDAIGYGLQHGHPPGIELTQCPEPLRAPAASFVTLKLNGALRGCIGSLEAYRPLAQDVAGNAYAAAFADPRFAPLSPGELPRLTLHISILRPPEPMTFDSEDALLHQLRPGVDGLILEAEGRRGTFLPAVWESLSSPRDFLHHLKLKAGLAPDYWRDDIKLWRYTTESIE
ncbi:MAG: AmmeMemoRadiSam system protein A [Gammaproteobacteria bacterium]|nr:AmmeMemoRadiSam system protein A [Gammaproteobacteria bacterium]NIR98117.1 AmmeMemoRadiSam system protein A [Gammaproteobacteria bacterium]NIT63809.1 AmmeMemoRadiSam system protein A [Gammaproteobacteria bacterium]NIV20759.1 AmmeMemoRadiSam system protein A [Gammaproteobacteria bacterium]NIX10008.1 AmmeMemoRadiSam system protein A [Gammaproteobacteria bacterium]